jgi:hypothetical protein
VFPSYAHQWDSDANAAHRQAVLQLWLFLRGNGIDAVVDQTAETEPRDWSLWMYHQIRDADVVLLIASAEYKRRADGDAAPTEGTGVQFEGLQVRDAFLANPTAGRAKFLPVLLPGHTADEIPGWIGPHVGTRYPVTDYTIDGAGQLIYYLTGQLALPEPPLGALPVLPTLTPTMPGTDASPDGGQPAPGATVTEAAVTEAAVVGAAVPALRLPALRCRGCGPRSGSTPPWTLAPGC